MIKILSEFYSFRFLVFMLTIRDLKLRYKQTMLGIIWVVLQPLLPLAIFTLVFGKVVKIDSHGIPYILFAFSGLIPWQFFSESINRCANCLVVEESLLTKVYFPKLILPFAKFITVFIDYLISSLIFILFLFIFDVHLTFRLFFFPIVLIMMMLLSLGFGIFVSALNVYFRDFRIITPFLLQMGLYASPVIYSTNMIPIKYQMWFFMNPMVGIIESFRWMFFENIVVFPFFAFLSTMVFSLFVFTVAIFVFKKVELFFADII